MGRVIRSPAMKKVRKRCFMIVITITESRLFIAWGRIRKTKVKQDGNGFIIKGNLQEDKE